MNSLPNSTFENSLANLPLLSVDDIEIIRFTRENQRFSTWR